MKVTTKVLMTCITSLSALTISTTSFADSTQTLRDTNGNTLKTGKAYCIRPTDFEPKVNITVDNDGYVNPTDGGLHCQYSYRLVSDDRSTNRSISAGETIRFEELKKGSNDKYGKTGKFLEYSGNYIRSVENNYQLLTAPIDSLPEWLKVKRYSTEFNLQLIEGNGVSKMRINKRFPSGDYVWNIPYSTDTGENWVELQRQGEKKGRTTFEFKPVS
ncbi:hypothetical protein II5_05957 [Bacillus cereus MSX-A1]|uniref:hypothetical protein n=1 Tax=Bacillus cereus TaxID=1396 RepID=UPI0002797C59|nr:hypothetical protein [Bacillus cereus]EJQ97318.1 hypothetical protein II5_05957 [Bacillus cereus MSX-A1]MDR4292718.1 hypothetical protein [Bacillus cereus]